MTIAIEPFAITKAGFSGSATQLSLTDSGTVDVPGQTVHFGFTLRDTDGAILQQGSSQLTSDQYNGWDGTSPDDTYLPTCIAKNLGLTPITS